MHPVEHSVAECDVPAIGRNNGIDWLKLGDDLQSQGWCRIAAEWIGEADVWTAVDRIAESLGRPAGGRAGADSEMLMPRTRAQSHARSQSATHGLGAWPVHVELSHRLIPCRYVVLGCMDPGRPTCATTTVEWGSAGFTPDETKLLKAAPLLVRNGRASFYSTALPADGRFLRWDAECIEPVDARGYEAIEVLTRRLSSLTVEKHLLEAGEILAIDNWRLLHGREAAPVDSGRRLLRRLVHA